MRRGFSRRLVVGSSLVGATICTLECSNRVCKKPPWKLLLPWWWETGCSRLQMYVLGLWADHNAHNENVVERSRWWYAAWCSTHQAGQHNEMFVRHVLLPTVVMTGNG